MKNNIFGGAKSPFFLLSMKLIYLSILILLTSCTYSVYSGRFPNLKTIKIEKFENKTTKYEIDDEVLNSLSASFISDGRLKVVNRNPDSVLQGKILKYKNEVHSYEDVTVTQYQLKITFSVKFMNLKKEEKIWEDESLTLNKIYSLGESADLTEAETNAAKEIYKDLFDKILSNSLEEW